MPGLVAVRAVCQATDRAPARSASCPLVQRRLYPEHPLDLWACKRRYTVGLLGTHCFRTGTENWYLTRALRRRGLHAHYVIQSPGQPTFPFPSIAGTEYRGRGGSGHFITILGQEEGRYLIGDPLVGRLLLTPEQLRQQYYMTGFFLVAVDPYASTTKPGKSRDCAVRPPGSTLSSARHGDRTSLLLPNVRREAADARLHAAGLRSE